MKKCLAILTALCLLAAAVSVSAMAGGVGTTNNKDQGEFQIFCVPDAYAAAEQDLNLYAFVEAGVKNLPQTGWPLDLVVFLGAIVVGAKDLTDYEIAAADLLKPVIEAEVPFAVVFGTQDAVPGASKADLFAIYEKLGGALFVNDDNPLDGEDSTNFVYPILNAQEKPFANLFFFDQGVLGEDEAGQPYISEAQINWFKGASEDAKTANEGKAVPSFVFQHIPMPEVYDYMLQTPFNWNLPGSKEVNGKFYYNLPNQIEMIGTVLETPTTARVSVGEFEALDEAGVRAVFFGNNPRNNYIVTYPDKAIQLVQLPGAAWNGAKGSFYTRGGAYIRIYKHPTTSEVTYTHSYFTYREADRVAGSKVDGVIFDLWDFFNVIPYLWQNFLSALAAPIRWIRGY